MKIVSFGDLKSKSLNKIFKYDLFDLKEGQGKGLIVVKDFYSKGVLDPDAVLLFEGFATKKKGEDIIVYYIREIPGKARSISLSELSLEEGQKVYKEVWDGILSEFDPDLLSSEDLESPFTVKLVYFEYQGNVLEVIDKLKDDFYPYRTFQSPRIFDEKDLDTEKGKILKSKVEILFFSSDLSDLLEKKEPWREEEEEEEEDEEREEEWSEESLRQVDLSKLIKELKSTIEKRLKFERKIFESQKKLWKE